MQPVFEVEETSPGVPVVVWSVPVGLILVVGIAAYLIARRKRRRVSN